MSQVSSQSSPAAAQPMTPRGRLLAVLQGRRPDRLPFAGRLELWHKGRVRSGTLPPDLAGLSLDEIHRRVGFTRQKFMAPYQQRLRGVEVEVHYRGERVYHDRDPLVERFPDMDFYAPDDHTGVTTTTLRTPVGSLTVEHTVLEQMAATGTRNYMSKHPILSDEDAAVAAYILERIEIVPRFEELLALDASFSEWGYVMPSIERIPFQQVLIDYYSTDSFFFVLHDSPGQVLGLMERLDEKVSEIVRQMAGLDVVYLQIGDNLDGMMTNPRLFRQYCLPAYQRFTEALHAQGKVTGSHTDGNLKPLLGLLAETGLDVCESFSPTPLTPVTVADALAVWPGKPIFWGGIPSPLLEDGTSDAEFEAAIAELLETIGDRLCILNVVDMVLPINRIERIARIAEMIEAHALPTGQAN